MTRLPLRAVLALGVPFALALACTDDGDASDSDSAEGAESGDPPQFARAIVESENPLALENPTVETVVWPLWGGAFVADQGVVLRASLTAGESGEDGLVIAVAGEESIGRGVALVRTESGWELQLRDGDIVDALELGGEAAAEIQLSVGAGGSSF